MRLPTFSSCISSLTPFWCVFREDEDVQCFRAVLSSMNELNSSGLAQKALMQCLVSFLSLSEALPMVFNLGSYSF